VDADTYLEEEPPVLLLDEPVGVLGVLVLAAGADVAVEVPDTESVTPWGCLFKNDLIKCMAKEQRTT
jgi:hypothetical protein